MSDCLTLTSYVQSNRESLHIGFQTALSCQNGTKATGVRSGFWGPGAPNLVSCYFFMCAGVYSCQDHYSKRRPRYIWHTSFSDCRWIAADPVSTRALLYCTCFCHAPITEVVGTDAATGRGRDRGDGGRGRNMTRTNESTVANRDKGNKSRTTFLKSPAGLY